MSPYNVYKTKAETGIDDYLLFIKGKTCGVIEAKREGKRLSDAALESEWYAKRKLSGYTHQRAVIDKSVTGIETFSKWRERFLLLKSDVEHYLRTDKRIRHSND